MLVPRKLSHFNVFLDGRIYAGIAKSVDLPDLEIKTEAFRGGGMDAPIPVEMGMESELELKFTLGEYYPDALTSFGFKKTGPLNLAFKGNKRLSGVDTQYAVDVTGNVTKIEHGTVESGKDTEMNLTMKLTYIRIAEAGIELVEIDILNLVRRVGGEDQLAAVKANLLI